MGSAMDNLCDWSIGNLLETRVVEVGSEKGSLSSTRLVGTLQLKAIRVCHMPQPALPTLELTCLLQAHACLAKHGRICSIELVLRSVMTSASNRWPLYLIKMECSKENQIDTRRRLKKLIPVKIVVTKQVTRCCRVHL